MKAAYVMRAKPNARSAPLKIAMFVSFSYSNFQHFTQLRENKVSFAQISCPDSAFKLKDPLKVAINAIRYIDIGGEFYIAKTLSTGVLNYELSKPRQPQYSRSRSLLVMIHAF